MAAKQVGQKVAGYIGPLTGVRVVELAGLAPGPFAGLVLADFGADVVRVDPTHAAFSSDSLSRNKRSISLSLKSPKGVAALQTLLSSPSSADKSLWRADVLIDPFRPGVLERLGLGPDKLLKSNPGLIIARLTGFRRDGPFGKMAGHDINYIALSGVLSMIGRKGTKPMFPLNTLADFGGGGIMAALGVLLAIIERNQTGKGQVVEVDMLTGARYLSSFPLMLSRPSTGSPTFSGPRGENMLDGGSPFYEVYETKDGKYMSVGALEPQFYKQFLTLLLANTDSSLIPKPTPTPDSQHDRDTWPTLSSFFTSAFQQRTRDEWSSIYVGTDSCCVPVLEPTEVDADGLSALEPGHKVSEDGSTPAPAPLLTRTPARSVGIWQDTETFYLDPGTATKEVMLAAGFSEAEIEDLIQDGAVRDTSTGKSKL
ncbi:CoA-transferase family III [Meredithblackwellia eburnea MCA 4105]